MTFYCDNNTSDAQFHESANKIATNVQEIFQNISTLQRLVRQYKLNEENNEIKYQLYEKRLMTQEIVTNTNNLFRYLDDCKNRNLKMQKERLIDEFTKALTSFQAIQRKTISFEKKSLRRKSSRIKPPPSTFFNRINSVNDENNDSSSNTSASSRQISQIQRQKQHEKINLNALEEQKRTIAGLESDIVTINEIYKKLGAMVYEQGTVVHTIHDNVNTIDEEIASGTAVLGQTSRNQMKFRKKMMCMILILLVVIVIVILSIGIWKKWF